MPLVKGDRDEVVPPAHQAALHRAAVGAGPKGASIVGPGGGHAQDARVLATLVALGEHLLDDGSVE